MCGLGTLSAPTTQLSTQVTKADPRAAAMYSSAWNNAQTVANRPFTPYSNDPNAFVAPMNSVQLSAVNDIYGMQNAGNPYYQAAPGMAYASGNTSAAGLVPSYMSPYLDSVAAATMGILGQQQGQQQNQLSGDIARNGQWGNSRSGVERALLSGQQNLATANTISNLYNTGYNTALGAAQTDLNRQLQAAQGLGTAGQTGAQNLLGAGTVGQQTQQAGLGDLRAVWSRRARCRRRRSIRRYYNTSMSRRRSPMDSARWRRMPLASLKAARVSIPRARVFTIG